MITNVVSEKVLQWSTNKRMHN